jgi:hypothetical protein
MAEPIRGQNPAGGTGSEASRKAQGAAASAAQKAQGAAASATQKAQDVASTVAQKADDALSSVGSGMSSLAGTLRDRGPQSGMLGGAASGLASGLESTGHYLQGHGVGDMFGDLSNVVRRHPIPALLGGFCLGYMLARVTSRG